MFSEMYKHSEYLQVAYEPLQQAPHPQTPVISVQITAIVCM
jgi:hypothetical protein